LTALFLHFPLSRQRSDQEPDAPYHRDVGYRCFPEADSFVPVFSLFFTVAFLLRSVRAKRPPTAATLAIPCFQRVDGFVPSFFASVWHGHPGEGAAGETPLPQLCFDIQSFHQARARSPSEEGRLGAFDPRRRGAQRHPVPILRHAVSTDS